MWVAILIVVLAVAALLVAFKLMGRTPTDDYVGDIDKSRLYDMHTRMKGGNGGGLGPF